MTDTSESLQSGIPEPMKVCGYIYWIEPKQHVLHRKDFFFIPESMALPIEKLLYLEHEMLETLLLIDRQILEFRYVIGQLNGKRPSLWMRFRKAISSRKIKYMFLEHRRKREIRTTNSKITELVAKKRVFIHRLAHVANKIYIDLYDYVLDF
jgi:hypothetical protein